MTAGEGAAIVGARRYGTPDEVQPSSHRQRRQRRRLLVVLVAALAVVTTAVLARDVLRSQSATSRRPELQRVLDGLVTGGGRAAPGAAAYVSGPRGTWVGSAGIANLRLRTPMRPDARMRLESVSKIYTATLILLLAEQGRLHVTDTVDRWLPGVLPYGKRITIRELLTMRSGLVDNNDFAARPAYYLSLVKDDALRARLRALARQAAAHPEAEVSPTWWIRWAAWIPLLFEPGTSSHYSNIGYDVLGLIATKATGQSLPTLYRRLILEPLGLIATAYDPQGPIGGPHANGYAIAPGGKLTDETGVHAAIGASGGIVSNAPETAAFLTALMTGHVLDRRAVAGMRGENLWRGGDDSGCAGPAYGWSGGGSGYKTNVWVSGDGSRVAVLLLNARGSGARQGADDDTAAAALVQLYCAA